MNSEFKLLEKGHPYPPFNFRGVFKLLPQPIATIITEGLEQSY